MISPTSSWLEPGFRLEGRFELIERIDPSGQAEVWRVKDLNVPKSPPQAIKINYAPLKGRENSEFDKSHARMTEEVTLMRLVNSRYVVRPHGIETGFHEISSEGQIVFVGMVMDLATEGNLEAFISSNPGFPRMPVPDKFTFIRRLAEGLQAIHSKDIIHNDIKANNVLVHRQDAQFIPQITDFGLAFKVGEVPPPGGTPQYLAPERIIKRSQPTMEGDIFSLGLVFCELLLGHHPLMPLLNHVTHGEEMEEFLRAFYSTDEPVFDADDIEQLAGPEFLELLESMCSKDLPRPAIQEVYNIVHQIEEDNTKKTTATTLTRTLPGLVDKFKWNPELHAVHQAHEYFFFLSGKRPNEDVQWLQERLRDKRISGATIMRIVGARDYLLRIWLTPADRVKVAEVLQEYGKQQFGDSTEFKPTLRLPLRPLKESDRPKTSRALSEALARMVDPTTRLVSQEAIKEKVKSGWILGQSKKVREEGRDEDKRHVRVACMLTVNDQALTNRDELTEGFVRWVADKVYAEVRQAKGASELEIFAYLGRDRRKTEFLIVCELSAFHHYKPLFERAVGAFYELNDEMIGQIRTYFELDATTEFESYDGCLIYRAAQLVAGQEP